MNQEPEISKEKINENERIVGLRKRIQIDLCNRAFQKDHDGVKEKIMSTNYIERWIADFSESMGKIIDRDPELLNKYESLSTEQERETFFETIEKELYQLED